MLYYPDFRAQTWVRTVREGKALCERLPEVFEALESIGVCINDAAS